MHHTCSRQAASMARLLTSPWLEASSPILVRQRAELLAHVQHINSQ
jgi:transposase